MLAHRQKSALWALLSALIVVYAGCATVEEAARDAVGSAVGSAVEQRMQSLLAGYTDPMLYQLAYTQAFHLGGFGIDHEAFEEGEGTTWRIEAADEEEVSSFTAERALLSLEDDGTSWWYLRYTPEGGEAYEYEVRIDRELQAREMYLRDPENDEVRHHEFASSGVEADEEQESEEGLEEAGYRTDYHHLEQWDEYRTDRVSVDTGAGTFDADLLTFTPTDEEAGESYRYRWWVSEDVPGQLVRFEYEDLEEEGSLHGEMIELRRDYQPRLRSE